MNSFWAKTTYEIWLEQATPEIKDWFQRELRYLKKNIKPNSKILDIGCGFGRHIQILANFSKEVVGVDNERSMIKKARKKLGDLGNVRLFLQDVKKLNFDDCSFDYVICMTGTFGNLLDKKLDTLKEMKRVCKNGGKIIISVYSEKALKTRLESYKKVDLPIIKIKGGTIYAEEGFISEQFTKPQLEKLFNSTDLKVKILKLNNISYICEAIKKEVARE